VSGPIDDPIPVSPLGPVGDDADEEPVEYELGDWTDQQRAELQARLEALSVPFEWSGTDIAVPVAWEDAVDALIDEIDDTGVADVEYELPEWTQEQRDDLAARLTEAAIPFGLDGTTFGVHEEHEAEVDALILAIDPGFPTESEEG
jgi:hypothetical protein